MLRFVAMVLPHAVVVLGIAVAYLALCQEIEWASSWGYLGLVGLTLHWFLHFSGWHAYAMPQLEWAESEVSVSSNATFSRSELSTIFWLEWPNALKTAALAGLTIALFRPQTSSTVENMTRDGIDMVLVMDLSTSMLSRDFKPNRLESAKEVAISFVDSRPFDRIGVVAYEGEAFTQVPITTDHIVVKNGLNQLKTGTLSGGTAIGTGLAIAINRLRFSEAKSKVIVLLTDGENNAGQIEPLDAAQLAQLNGIRVYTIGVGSIGKAKSPVAIRPDGSYQYDWVDVRIDEEVLQGIAEMTDARYFRATNADKLKEIYKEIDSLEKTKFNVLRYQRKTEAASSWILFALFCLAGGFLLKTSWLKTIAE